MMDDEFGASRQNLESVLGTPFFNELDQELSVLSGERELIQTMTLRGIAQACEDRGLQSPSELSKTERYDLALDLEPFRKRLVMLKNLEAYIDAYQQEGADSVLKPHQQDVFDRILSFVRNRSESSTPDYNPDNPEGILTKAGHIVLPTASGKAVVAVEFVKALRGDPDSLDLIAPPKTLLLVPRKVLLKQMISRDGKRGFGRFAPDVPVSAYYGEEKDLSGDVVVMTYQSFTKAIDTEEFYDDVFDVVIADEAHHGLGRKTQAALTTFCEGKLSIALTATPEYSPQKQVGQIFPELIAHNDLRTSIEAGILAGVQCWSYKTDANIIVDSYEKLDFTKEELAPLIENAARNRHAIDFTKAFVEQGLQGVVACIPGGGCYHAQKLAEELNSAEVVDPETGGKRLLRAAAVGSFLDNEELDLLLKKYEEGEIDVLTYVKIIGEGWDSDRAKFLINLCPTASQVRAIQRLGRVLRPNNEGQFAQVVEFIDEVVGKYKAQYTFLHALGESMFKQGWVYDSNQYTDSGERSRGLSIASLPEDLRKRLLEIDARKIDELIVLPRDIEIAPEEWIPMSTIQSLAPMLSAQSLRKFLKKHGFEGVIARGEISTPCYWYAPDSVGFIKENLILEVAPPDWMTITSLRRELGVSQDHVERLVADLEFEAKISRDHRNKLTLHYSPEDCNQLRQIVSAYQFAPDDWKHPRRIAEEIGITDNVVRRFFSERGIVGKRMRLPSGGFSSFYAPEQLSFIRTAYANLQDAPEGWLSIGGIRNEWKFDTQLIKTILAELPDHGSPELMRHNRGRVTSYYPPETVEYVKNALQANDIPEGWLSFAELKRQFGISYRTALTELTKAGFEPQHLRQPKKKVMPYYSPEAFAHLESIYSNSPVAKEGWLSVTEIIALTGITHRTVNKFIESLSIAEAHKHELMRSRRAKLRVEHYPPEIVAAVVEKLSAEAIPDTWYSQRELEELYGLSRMGVVGYLGKQGVVGKMSRVGRSLTLCYPPAAGELLKVAYGNVKTAEDGWYTASEIGRLCNTTSTTVKTFIDSLELDDITQPELMRIRVGTGAVKAHYPPRVLELALENIKFDEIPEGWERLSKFSRLYGVSEAKLLEHLESSELYANELKPKSSGRRAFYIPPEAKEALGNQYSVVAPAEDGWVAINKIVATLGVKEGSVKQYFAEHSEDPAFQPKPMRAAGKGRIWNYYSPEAFANIKAAFERTPVPDEWVSLNSIAKQVDIGPGNLRGFVASRKLESLLLKAPGDHNPQMYVPPATVEALMDAYKDIPHAPGGWLTAQGISHHTDFSVTTVRKYLRGLKLPEDEQPQRMRSNSHRSRRIFEHYSPGVAAKAIAELKELSAPEGWSSLTVIASKAHVAYSRLKTLVEENEIAGKLCISGGVGGRVVYYSPETAAQILELAQN